MRHFGEPPAYAGPLVLAAAVLCIAGGLAHTFLIILELHRDLGLGLLSVALAFAVFLFGLMLLIRHVEARDAMHDPRPRSRQYDRHERPVYLAGLVVTALASALAVVWGQHGSAGAWHYLTAFITAAAALVFLRLWRARL